MTRTGDREIRSVSGRLPDNPGELARMLMAIIVSLIKLMKTLLTPVAVPGHKELHKLITSCSEISSKNKGFTKFPERKERSDS